MFSKKNLLLALFSLLALTFPQSARAQFVGFVELQTVSKQLANAVSCTGSSQTFLVDNLGQISHQASATSTAASFSLEIDGTDATGATYRISNGPISFVNGATTSYIAQGFGYYAIPKVVVSCSSGATFSLSYSGGQGAFSTLVGPPGGNPINSGGNAGNVQGIVATGTNGVSIFPIVNGALGPPTNAGFTQFGVDTFSSSTQNIALGFTGNIVAGSPPPPSTSQDFAFVFYFKPGSGTGGTGLAAPWTCQTLCAASANVGNAAPEVATLANVNTTNSVVENIINNQTAGNQDTVFVLFQKTPSIQQNRSGQFANVFSFVSNTLAGSTLLVEYQCAAFPCQIDAVTDTQGNAWKQLTSLQTQGTGGGISIWMTGPTSAAAETVTATQHAGTTISGSAAFELTGVTAANINQPSVPVFAAPGTATGRQALANETDQGGLFTAVGGFSYTQTLTFSTAATTSVSLWDLTKEGAFQSCTVEERVTNIAGAGTTLNTFLQDSADNIGFNDRLSMPQATTVAGAQNFIGALPTFTASNLTATASSAVVSTNGTLAAGSGIAGPLGPFGRIQFVSAGGAVAVTVTFNVTCR